MTVTVIFQIGIFRIFAPGPPLKRPKRPPADSGVWGLSHTVALSMNLSTGAVNASIDGALVGSGVLSGANLNTFNEATNMAGFIGVRGSLSGTSPSSPTSATFTNVAVVPEPGLTGIVVLTTGMLVRRRRALLAAETSKTAARQS
jgi:hypothetical protein